MEGYYSTCEVREHQQPATQVTLKALHSVK